MFYKLREIKLYEALHILNGEFLVGRPYKIKGRCRTEDDIQMDFTLNEHGTQFLLTLTNIQMFHSIPQLKELMNSDSMRRVIPFEETSSNNNSASS